MDNPNPSSGCEKFLSTLSSYKQWKTHRQTERETQVQNRINHAVLLAKEEERKEFTKELKIIITHYHQMMRDERKVLRKEHEENLAQLKEKYEFTIDQVQRNREPGPFIQMPQINEQPECPPRCDGQQCQGRCNTIE